MLTKTQRNQIRILSKQYHPYLKKLILKLIICVIVLIAAACVTVIILNYLRTRSNRTPVLSLEKSIESDFFQKREKFTDGLLKKRQEGEYYSEETEFSESEESEIDFRAKMGENLTSENTNSSDPVITSVKSCILDGEKLDEEEEAKSCWVEKIKKIGLKKTKTQVS